MDEGALKVIALEPEPSNLELCRTNLAGVRNSLATVEVQAAAVAHGAGPEGNDQRDLILGRTRSDGVGNTWRHALDGLSHYRNQDADGGEDQLERIRVRTVPLFGQGGMLTGDISFVKLDCEGAEIELLEGVKPGEWLNVQRLVFEWSFTKVRCMKRFTSVVAQLEAEGFTVAYEGKGNWEKSFEEWPWAQDALVYAWRP